jgi:hypothetical protein
VPDEGTDAAAGDDEAVVRSVASANKAESTGSAMEKQKW